MSDARCTTLLAEDPKDSVPYTTGRPFLLRSESVQLLPPSSEDKTLTRRARFFASPHGDAVRLILLIHPELPDPPHRDPLPLLGCTEAELDPLLELPNLSTSFVAKANGSLSLRARVGLGVVSMLKESHPWLLPLLIPRRLPSSFRLLPLASPAPVLSLWIRLR